ncbi:MAG: HU family DNA-binding protein [Bacteroidales bacterium]|uniref:HU family DNA-binding protein n=1 Tax=Porphyromonas sp. TaxID=1924944 RepID=UPI002977EB2A|nr:HU family DNA-binding protein [Porphyromonas sp.]MDD7438702.1 HU family DNA-binding protein [Bacteroidales bacterium]MDY3066960.1 HU family DNA-binding protein [Porphyromonas sp.]
MALIYNVYERENKIPNAKMPRMAVAYNRQIRQVSTKELADDIADRCTVHRVDVRAVLDALSLSATQYLLNGFGVQLGELGSFSMRIRCKAAPSLAEFKPEMITGAKVYYTPSVEILNKIKSNGFVSAASLMETTKAPSTSANSAGDTPSEGEPSGDDLDL